MGRRAPPAGTGRDRSSQLDDCGPRLDVEGHLIEIATGLDISGARPDDLPEEFLREVLAAHPRGALAKEFTSCVVDQAERKPTTGARRLVDSGWPTNFNTIRSNGFAETNKTTTVPSSGHAVDVSGRNAVTRCNVRGTVRRWPTVPASRTPIQLRTRSLGQGQAGRRPSPPGCGDAPTERAERPGCVAFRPCWAVVVLERITRGRRTVARSGCPVRHRRRCWHR